MIDVIFVRAQADSDGSADLTHAVNDVLHRLRVNGENPVAAQVVSLQPSNTEELVLRGKTRQNLVLCVTLQRSGE